ncbi:MAG: polysaccharide biosynthesis protein, partial [Myxococcales bacterium]|nr:polysaccharide biosynthesis protein [Myxococcales bacterium]
APYVTALEYGILILFGVHRFSWRYVGLRETRRVLAATLTASAVLLASRIIVGELQQTHGYLRHGVLPLGTLAANTLLMFLAVVGVRVMRRIAGERAETVRRRPRGSSDATPTMLIGAGQAGLLVARELALRPDLGLSAVGFLDDDPTKVGTVVHGVPVLGGTDRLGELCTRYGAKQVLIAMASAPGTAVRRIRAACEAAEVPVKIIPGLYELVDGRAELSRIREVAIEDLLRREPIQLDEEGIGAFIEDRIVMVTGAGGSIGSELCRQICRFEPKALLLVEQAENNLFQIHRELRGLHPELQLLPRIADVTDEERMRELFASHRPSAVFHAAAHKHVPMMEWNPGEAVKNNVFGTRIVADLAQAHRAEVFVMVSTDKAVNPTSVMGATKRVAELYVQSLAEVSETHFVTVRFGNVLGSTGSVVPIFKEQITRGGPITVTHPEMRRYFMTIPEACQLVLEAASMGGGGEIFILDMGESVRIVDLARDLIALSGLQEGEDISIEFTGMRPGEKLFEELSTDAEHADKTRHPKIFIGRTEERSHAEVVQGLERLANAVETAHAARSSEGADALETKGMIRGLLEELVPHYVPDANPTIGASRAPIAADPRSSPAGLALAQATRGAD